MGKGDRRGKAMPELAKVKGKPKQPRSRGRFTKPTEDARRTGLDARAMHFGGHTTPEQAQALSGQHMGAAIGMVMQRQCPADVPRLWAVWQAWCMAERTYAVRIIGQTGSPKGASIAYIPERMETDTGHTIDARSADEKDRDAVNGWMRWRGFLGHLPSEQATALHHARREDGPALWTDRKPTRYGLETLAALERLADVVEG